MIARDRLAGVISAVAATLAASCCILPIALIVLGLAGAGLMMSMMRYEWLTLPLGVGGLMGAFLLYARERRRCSTEGCRVAGDRITRLLLAVATFVVTLALLLRLFPSWTSRILQAIALA